MGCGESVIFTDLKEWVQQVDTTTTSTVMKIAMLEKGFEDSSLSVHFKSAAKSSLCSIIRR